MRSPARYLWVTLLARLLGSLPLTCPHRAADRRVVACANVALDPEIQLEWTMSDTGQGILLTHGFVSVRDDIVCNP